MKSLPDDRARGSLTAACATPLHRSHTLPATQQQVLPQEVPASSASKMNVIRPCRNPVQGRGSSGERADRRDQGVQTEKVLHEAADHCRQRIAGKSVIVEVIIHGRSHAVRGDSGVVRQLMMDLLSFSAHSTERGRITAILIPDEGIVRLTIADTGAGFTAKQLSRFCSVKGRRPAGEAAGCVRSILAARSAVRRLGGNIVISSKQGAGTVTEIMLPRDAAPSP